MIHLSKKQLLWLIAVEVIASLLFLHYALTSPAVFQSRFGVVCYIAFYFFIIALVGVAFSLAIIKKIPLHKVFLFLGFCFGVLSCLINTPGSIPDEPMHASNIYLWSNRLMLLKESGMEQENPVYIDIRSVERLADNQVAPDYLGTATTIDSYRQILQNTNWFYSKSDNQLVHATLRDHSVSPVVYLPAIFGFTIARLLSFGYYPMLMLGRLMMLAFYVFAASWSIKKIPVGKMALFITALLPMSIHLAASLSYDAVILSLAMMLFATIVYLAYGDLKRVGTKEWLMTLALSVLLAPCKVGVYLPIILLLLMVPSEKLGGKRKFVVFFTSIVAASIISCVLMNLNAISIGTNNAQVQHDSRHLVYSAQWVLHHPTDAFQMMLNTTRERYFSWMDGAVGSYLSWFTIKLDSWIITGFEVCLLLTAMKTDDAPSIAPAPLQRLLLLVPVVLCNFIFLFGMLLWWTPIGAPLIDGIQGRYFIPMIPLILFAIPQISITLHLKRGERIFPWKNFSSCLTMACVLLSCASLLNQVSVILSR